MKVKKPKMEEEIISFEGFIGLCRKLIHNPDYEFNFPYNLHNHIRDLINGKGHLVDIVEIYDHYLQT